MKLLSGLLLLMLGIPALGGAEPVAIQEWQVPWPNTRPRDPDVAPDGSIWLVGQAGHYVAQFNPQTEQFRRLELPDGAGPHNLIVDQDSTIWYAGNLQAHIGRLNPVDGGIHQIAMPDPAAKDPHTLVFAGNDLIWFTLQHSNMIGRLNKITEQVDLIKVPTDRSRPYGILVTPEGQPWVVLVGTNKLATIDLDTLAVREINLPRDQARPRRIARTTDGMIWYVDYAGGYLGCYDPGSGKFKEWLAPAGEMSRPYAMATDDQNRLWFVETGPSPNVFVGFNPASETFFSVTPIPSGAGSVRHMVFDPQRRAFWFGTDTNFLAIARLP